MWLRGVTVIITSNYNIDQLFSGGCNRDVPRDFFPEFAERCPELEMSSAFIYRSVGVEGSGNFVVGINDANLAVVDEKWKEHAGEFTSNVKLEISFGNLFIDIKATGNDQPVARLDSDVLCGMPLGRSVYALIATTYSTVFIDNIRKLGNEEFKRFVSFIDMLYDKKVILHTCFAVYDIFRQELEAVDEKLAWSRCKSMMTEMESTKCQGMAWLMRRHLVQDTATHL